MEPNGTTFSGKRRALIDRLALPPYPSLAEAARLEGVAESTAKKWNMDPGFRQAWQDARRLAQNQLRDDALARIRSLVPAAIDAVEALMGQHYGGTIRQKAAETVLEYGLGQPKQVHEHSGPDGGPIVHEQRLDLDRLSDDELDTLERLIAQSSGDSSQPG